MGDKLKSSVRRVATSPLALGAPVKEGEVKGLHKKITQTGEKPFRKGATAAKRTAAAEIAKQQQMEKVRLAESDSEIATKRAAAGGKVGRRSLIKSSGAGLSVNLGGTVGG